MIINFILAKSLTGDSARQLKKYFLISKEVAHTLTYANAKKQATVVLSSRDIELQQNN